MFLGQNLEQSSYKLKTIQKSVAYLVISLHADPGEFKIITIVFLVFMKLLEAHWKSRLYKDNSFMKIA